MRRIESLAKWTREYIENLAKWTREHANNIGRIAVAVIFVCLAIWGILLQQLGYVIGQSGILMFLTTACTNVAPELAGIVIGIVTIDYLNDRRQEQQLKKQLKLQLGSTKTDVTDTAISTLTIKFLYTWQEITPDCKPDGG